MIESMSREIRVTTVMHDTVDLDQAVDFWTSVLGIEVLERAGNYVYLGRLGEDAPHLAFQLVPEEKQVKNRLHLDIKVPIALNSSPRWRVSAGGGWSSDRRVTFRRG